MENQEFESILEDYPVRLENFEGPLDLLLHLIKKNEVNICDIPIALITQHAASYSRHSTMRQKRRRRSRLSETCIASSTMQPRPVSLARATI